MEEIKNLEKRIAQIEESIRIMGQLALKMNETVKMLIENIK